MPRCLTMVLPGTVSILVMIIFAFLSGIDENCPLTGRAAAQYQESTLQYRLDELEMICYRQINEGAEGQLKVGVPKSLVDRRTVQAQNELRFFLDQNPSESDLFFDHKTFAAATPLRHLRAYPRLNNFQRSWGDKPGS